MTAMEPSRDEIRQWIRGILARTGDTPTGLARRAGVASTTLTRFMGGQARNALSFSTIAKIAEATGTPPPFADGGERLPGFAEDDAAPYHTGGLNSEPSACAAAISALIAGRRAADPWKMRSRVLEDAGYLPGDVLIVDLTRTPTAGDVVCAQVYNWGQDSAETVFRIYEPPYLVAATAAPEARKPLLVDGKNVVIKGVVTESLRIS